MRRTRLIFLALAMAGLVSAGASPQSIPQERNGGKATDPFSGIHESLDLTVNGLVAAAGSYRSGDPAKEERDTEEGVPLARETGRAVSVSVFPRTLAMARLERLRPLLDPILRSEEIPLDLAFVVVVESGGKPDALSPKGARGLWQLMPETARRYGLVVDRDRDERLDIAKSTRVAARYLRDLYSQFQSWPVALAAYNAGEQAVQNAIDRAQSNEFGILGSSELLPYETRTYVTAVMNFVARSGGMPSAVQEVTPQRREERIVYAAQASEVRP